MSRRASGNRACRLKTILASRRSPAVYVVFDLLFQGGRSVMGQPLRGRRQILADMLHHLDHPRVILSDGVVGSGRALFEQVVRQGHEGVMAKHLGSRYLPGRRSSSWIKIKPTETIVCVIIGYIPSKSGFRSLLVAAQREGGMQYVGEVSCGLTRDEWANLLAGWRPGRRRRHPTPRRPEDRAEVYQPLPTFCHRA